MNEEILAMNFKKLIVVTIILLGVLLSLFVMNHYAGESFSSFRLYEMNGTYTPPGPYISINETDFGLFPQLAAIVRDNKQKPAQIYEDGSRLYIIPLTEDQMYQFNQRYWSGSNGEDKRIFKYRDKFFQFTFPEIH